MRLSTKNNSTQPGPTFQLAPRIFVAMLPALKTLVMDGQTKLYLRLYSWWTILQCWCTQRFSDHRGIRLSSVTIQRSSLSALLSWSELDASLTQPPSKGTISLQGHRKPSQVARSLAIQSRVMSILPTFDRRLFTVSVPRFWSPHSGRNFLQSAASALGFSKADRAFLGGWATKGSDV